MLPKWYVVEGASDQGMKHKSEWMLLKWCVVEETSDQRKKHTVG